MIKQKSKTKSKVEGHTHKKGESKRESFRRNKPKSNRRSNFFHKKNTYKINKIILQKIKIKKGIEMDKDRDLATVSDLTV